MLPRIVLLREIIRLPRWLLCVFPLLHTRELARRLWQRMCRLRTLLLVVGIGDRLVVWLMMGIISSAIEIVDNGDVLLLTEHIVGCGKRDD